MRWARSTRHKNKLQKSNFLHLKLWWPAGSWKVGGRENFFSKKFELKIVLHLSENSSTLDPIKGGIFKIQNDKCHTLSLWTWHMSNTWTLNLTSVLHMSKFAHSFSLGREIQILNFLPSFLRKSAHWPEWTIHFRVPTHFSYRASNGPRAQNTFCPDFIVMFNFSHYMLDLRPNGPTWTKLTGLNTHGIYPNKFPTYLTPDTVLLH